MIYLNNSISQLKYLDDFKTISKEKDDLNASRKQYFSI